MVSLLQNFALAVRTNTFIGVTTSAGNSTGGVSVSPSTAGTVTTNGHAPPHLRKKAPASVAGSEMSNNSNFAKVKTVSFI